MKRVVLIIICIAMSIPLFAQKAQIKDGYDYQFFDPRGITQNQDFILLAGHDCSKFDLLETDYR